MDETYTHHVFTLIRRAIFSSFNIFKKEPFMGYEIKKYNKLDPQLLNILDTVSMGNI